jgi:hypothetical protein
MKAKSISYIRNILKKEESIARDEYNNFKKYLIKKYQSDWICREMNEMEKEQLVQSEERYREVLRVLEDFEAHQW